MESSSFIYNIIYTHVGLKLHVHSYYTGFVICTVYYNHAVKHSVNYKIRMKIGLAQI